MASQILSKLEIGTLRHALYCLREMQREQRRLALCETSAKSARDAERFNKLISFSLTLDEKLTSLENEAPSPKLG